MPIAPKWLKLQSSNLTLIRDSTDVTPNFFSKKGRRQGDMTPKFWGLNANDFKMVKATD